MPTRDSDADFARLREAAVAHPDVEAGTRYDGSSVLRLAGVFMASLATHATVEPGTIVVRCDEDTRQSLLADAPDTYYVTDYYAPYPLILARLDRLDRSALEDLLAMSHRLTLPKTRRGRGSARKRANTRES